MERHLTPRGGNRYAGSPAPLRPIGAAVLALSFLRWPLTAMLVSSAWASSASQWLLVLAVQASAEALFWMGAWLFGRDALRAALARVAGRISLRAILSPSAPAIAGAVLSITKPVH